MSTFISLHVNSDKQSHLTKILQKLSDADEMTYGSYPQQLDENILDVNSNPTYLAVGNVKNGWINIHINSFKKLSDWSKKISKELNCGVIQIMGQTTSDAYYFLMYTNGSLRREIEIYYGDFDKTIDLGAKFSFEKKSLVPKTDDDYDDLFNTRTLEK